MPTNAEQIVQEVADVLKAVERDGRNATPAKRVGQARAASERVEPLIHAYYSVTEAERTLIEDTINLWQQSIHRSNPDSGVPALAFPELVDRATYSNTLCSVLNRRSRKQGVQVSAQGMSSETFGLVFLTVVFGEQRNPYREPGGDIEVWHALDRARAASQTDSGNLSFLRGFTYFEPDRLHILKPATMRNWCRTAALNDADAIFEYLNTR